ncbi:ATPase/protein kinase [Bacillus sp. VT-16-64]|nr:ATPase/protein kinase [Bacillus sp. VT-16-64]
MDERKYRKFIKRSQLEPNVDEYCNKVLDRDRMFLSKAITLIESNAPRHERSAGELLQRLLPHTGNSIRIGITGVPGAGKSTFIEAFGLMLCELGHRVAVLAVDPSSAIRGGSILGDKTRMEQLSKHPNAFIRPSPSEGTLGGVHRKTRETILVCEAAGYDVILVETVGVGQSEGIVRGMVDFFMMLAITGAGDELQGMKKGIMELVDAIIVNKADGDNVELAKKTAREFKQMLHFVQSPTNGWTPRALPCSSLKGTGMEDVWEIIQQFAKETKSSGVFESRRKKQAKDWLYSLIDARLQKLFFEHAEIKKLLPKMEHQVMSEEITVKKACDQLFTVFNGK